MMEPSRHEGESDPIEHLEPVLGVTLHGEALFFGQQPRVENDRIGYADFADIVQLAGQSEDPPLRERAGRPAIASRAEFSRTRSRCRAVSGSASRHSAARAHALTVSARVGNCAQVLGGEASPTAHSPRRSWLGVVSVRCECGCGRSR